MKTSNKQHGQTLIETAIILILLLLILFGITEFARGWFTKNSLKNAVRHGARVAVVTSSPTNTTCPLSSGRIVCNASRTFTACPDTGIVNAVCSSPGISNNSGVSICYKDEAGGTANTLDRGDTINVCGRTTFNFAIGGQRMTFLGIRIWPWPSSMNMITDASMRYE